MRDQFPIIGVGVIITNSNSVLLAKRKNSHGEGSWTAPGGHLEKYESVLNCAIRETEEETGIKLNPRNINELGFTEDIFKDEGKHYITCFVCCDVDKTLVVPKLMEPDKFSSEWIWFDYEELPTPLFIPIVNALEKFRREIFFSKH